MSARGRCLVIGGSGLVGGAVCEALAAAGARVALTFHRQEQRALTLAARTGGLALRLDLGQVDDVERVVEAAARELDGLDALICCAGTAPRRMAWDDADDAVHDIDRIDAAGWDALMAVNLRGPFFACREAARHMRRGGGGDIVLLGSVDGVKALPGPVDHATSRAGLAGMVRSLAKAFGQDGIRVNAIAPGLLEQGLGHALATANQVEYDKHVALRRRGRPEEIAQLVARLALDNSYLTGQTVVVDGAL